MKTPRLIIYSDKAGLLRWRLVSRNGRIIADCAEGYSSVRAVKRAWATVVEAVLQADWKEDDDLPPDGGNYSALEETT